VLRVLKGLPAELAEGNLGVNLDNPLVTACPRIYLEYAMPHSERLERKPFPRELLAQLIRFGVAFCLKHRSDWSRKNGATPSSDESAGGSIRRTRVFVDQADRNVHGDDGGVKI
jgi:hypothetical protein